MVDTASKQQKSTKLKNKYAARGAAREPSKNIGIFSAIPVVNRTIYGGLMARKTISGPTDRQTCSVTPWETVPVRGPGLGKNGPGKNGPGKNGPGKNGPEKTVRGIGSVVESVKTVRSFR